MSDRSFMKCPLCRDNGNANPPEMLRDAHIFTCPLGHSMTQERLAALNPEKIKLQFVWKPGTGDIKCEFWINQEVYQKAHEALGDRIHKTVDSILRAAMNGEYVLIDGKQAEELHKLGVRNGAEMLAVAKQNQSLVAENESLVEQVNRWERRIAEAMQGA